MAQRIPVYFYWSKPSTRQADGKTRGEIVTQSRCWNAARIDIAQDRRALQAITPVH
jgi:hypothetical protein